MSTASAQPGARIHGGLPHGELRALGIDAADVLDVSANCNPYGPCASVVDAIRSAPIDRYPDPTAAGACEAIAGALGVAADRVALGNGAAELLWTLASVLVRPGTGVVVAEPTFCELRAAAAHAGGAIHEWRARADDGFAIDLAAVGQRIRDRAAAVAYLCAPGTPTGNAIPATAALGAPPAPSTTGFLVVRVGDACAVRERLLVRHRVLVRDCASFGLPEHIRIAAHPASDRARLVAALTQELP